MYIVLPPGPGKAPGICFRFSHFSGDGTCQNIAVGGEFLAWEPAELCGGQYRGVFGRSSGFSTNLVGMVLALVANAICISIYPIDQIKN